MTAHPTLEFVGIDDLAERPHVIVDGAPRPGTVLTLTHWPATPTPRPLWRDLSAEIVLAYLRHPDSWVEGVRTVSSDHLDEDGLVSLYVLVDPTGALARANVLVEVARGGDFGVVADRRTAQITFALRAFFDRARSPLEPAADLDTNGWTTACYRALLELTPALFDFPDADADLAAAELAHFDASCAALARGDARLVEYPEVELAVVEVLEPPTPGSSPTADANVLGLHRDAITSATDCSRVLVARGTRFEYFDRYETWVRFVSRRRPLRRDLAPLADALDERERTRGTWRASDPGALRPVLSTGGKSSSIDLEGLVGLVTDYLGAAPPAWDPFAEKGSAPRVPVSGPATPTGGTSGRDRSRWRGRRRAAP